MIDLRAQSQDLKRRLLLLAIVVMLPTLLAAQAALAQQVTHQPGELAFITALDSRNPSRLQASVGGGRYALALENADARATVAEDEKLFILTLGIFNEAGPPREINKDTLELLVTDRMARTHNEYIRLRYAGTDETADSVLMPGRTMLVDAVFRVPLSADIVEAYVSDADHGKPPGARYRFNTQRSLPRDISPDGITVAPSVPGKLGVWYPLGGADIKVVGYSFLEEPIGRYIPTDTVDILAIEFLARNRLNEPLDIRSAIFRKSGVFFDGIRTGVRDVWMRDFDNAVSWSTRPGEVVPLRVMMKVGKGGAPDTIHFAEHLGPRSGLTSRTYEIDFSQTGNDPDAIQADGGRVVRPPTPGSFDTTDLLAPVPTLGDPPPTSIDPGLITTDPLPTRNPDIPGVVDLIAPRKGSGVIVTLGQTTADSMSVGKFKAQGGIELVAFGDVPIDSCEVTTFELVLLPKRQDPVSTLNYGARFSEKSRRLINTAVPADTVIIWNTKLSCPETYDTANLQISSAAYRLR